MKFIKILFIFIFYIGIAQNNTVAIQDPNFEQALIDLNIDNSLNGQVQLDAIDSLTILDVSGKNIVNLNGIQNFTALGTLKVSNNQLSFIDVSDLDSLNFLDASSNNLSDFALNSSIEELKFQHNQLEFVDLSNFGNLVTIILNDNIIPQQIRTTC
jgi:Leucine-rich repeat (LRR) protein